MYEEKTAPLKRTCTLKISNKDTRYAALQVFSGIIGRREAVNTKATYLKEIKISLTVSS